MISAREVSLPKCKSGLKALAVYLHAARRTVLVVSLYRPGSDVVSNVFFDDLDDILELTSTYACHMITMGDLNLHPDVTLDPSAVRFQTAINSYGLLQHISSPTHRAGHLFDVFITRTNIPIHDVDVQPPEKFDHSFITLSVDTSVPTWTANKQHSSTSVARLQLRQVLRRFKLVVVALRPSTRCCRDAVHHLLPRHSAGAC